MYWLKSCPRCKGDLVEKDDIHGKDIMCVQCGFCPVSVEVLQLRRRLAQATLNGKAGTLLANG